MSAVCSARGLPRAPASGFAKGETSRRSELREVEDEAILEALDRQRQMGLEIFTDGEFRRASWITDMAEAVEGFVPQSRIIEWRGLERRPRPKPAPRMWSAGVSRRGTV